MISNKKRNRAFGMENNVTNNENADSRHKLRRKGLRTPTPLNEIPLNTKTVQDIAEKGQKIANPRAGVGKSKIQNVYSKRSSQTKRKSAADAENNADPYAFTVDSLAVKQRKKRIRKAGVTNTDSLYHSILENRLNRIHGKHPNVAIAITKPGILPKHAVRKPKLKRTTALNTRSETQTDVPDIVLIDPVFVAIPQPQNNTAESAKIVEIDYNEESDKENMEPQHHLRKRKLHKRVTKESPTVKNNSITKHNKTSLTPLPNTSSTSLIQQSVERNSSKKTLDEMRNCSVILQRISLPNNSNTSVNESNQSLCENSVNASLNQIQSLTSQSQSDNVNNTINETVLISPINRPKITVNKSADSTNVTKDDSDIEFFDAAAPEANSTMLGVDLKQQSATPWRIDERMFKRNPHFLQLKENIVPSYNQELVLVPNSGCTPRGRPADGAQKAMVQTTLKDFIDVNRVKTRAKRRAEEEESIVAEEGQVDGENEERDEDVHVARLFDDEDMECSFPDLNRREYAPKKRYRMRVNSTNSERGAEPVIHRHKPKQKHIDPEFEKWAESFNKHCEEIDQEDLEFE